MTFEHLGLSLQLQETLKIQGYTTPTTIQRKAIPVVLSKRDIMAAAQTGTGKTAAFALPLIENLLAGEPVKSKQIRALILTPTRELACQVAESIKTYSQNLAVKSMVAYGGVKIAEQIEELREGVDILVATPGRLLDLFGKHAISFKRVEAIILDEADRMLDLGFFDAINEILNLLPRVRQSMMFSATFSNDIRTLGKQFLNDPVEISVDPENTTAITVKQWIHPVDEVDKLALLIKLIQENKWEQVLVFVNTRVGADLLTESLQQAEIQAVAIHSNKPQTSRTKTFARFKEGSIRVLVATDIAARGLDIDHLPHVVNYTLPVRPEDYVHRIGRTGRAGTTGEAISLVSSDEFYYLNMIERLINKILKRVYVQGFAPQYLFPESSLEEVKVQADKKEISAKKPIDKKKKVIASKTSRHETASKTSRTDKVKWTKKNTKATKKRR